MEVIKISNLSKNYVIKQGLFSSYKDKVVEALSDINIQIEKGTTVGLIGLNGAGKSTLIKIILGILTPTNGNVEVFSRDPFKNRVQNLFNIGVIFGQKTQLRWDLSPLDSYKLNKSIYEIPNEKFEENLKKYIEVLDLKSFMDRPVRTLSLGQKMRADLLSALLHSPELLILDEPTIGVDIFSKNKIIELIKQLKKETTIIYTSHNLSEVYEISDRIIVLNKGKVILDKNKVEIKDALEYISLRLYLKRKLKYKNEKFKTIQSEEINEYEHHFHFIKKSELKNFLDYIYSNNEVDYFEIKEDNLEKLLKEVLDG